MKEEQDNKMTEEAEEEPIIETTETGDRVSGIPVASLSFLSNIRPDFWD